MASRKVTVAHRSGYDKTYRNSLTGDVGTLIPLFFDEVIPDSKVNLKINVAASLPPLVSDTYMNVRLCVEAFAVPLRILYGNFEDFYDDYLRLITATDVTFNSRVFTNMSGCVPLIRLYNPDDSEYSDYLDKVISNCGAGSLLDFLDFNIETGDFVSPSVLDVSVLPLVCYHLIWQEWYRNPRVQKPAFTLESDSVGLVSRGDSRVLASSVLYQNCFWILVFSLLLN